MTESKIPLKRRRSIEELVRKHYRENPVPVKESATKFPLEKVPSAILQDIFDYVSPTDLLSLCVTSKKMHEVAAARLYKRITINTLATQLIDYNMPNWTHNYCVIIKPYQFTKLLETVKGNKKLASFVKSLNAVSEVKDLHQILPFLQLSEFHCSGPFDIPKETAKGLKKLTWVMSKNVFYAPNLEELKVFEIGQVSKNHYAALAKAVFEQGSHKTLKKLVFERKPEAWNVFPPDEMGANTHEALWVQFFIDFYVKKKKLSLTHLSVDGDLKNFGPALGELIGIVQNEGCLKTLEVNCNENLHIGRKHDGYQKSFLEAVTKGQGKIQNLFIRHNNDCTICEMHSLVRTFAVNIRDQLKSLTIMNQFRAPDAKETRLIRMSILESQSKLVRLKLEDQIDFKPKSELAAMEYEDDRYWTKYKELLLASSVPQHFKTQQPRPVHGEHTKIKRGRPIILQQMKTDSLYNMAAKQLPNLREYGTIDLEFDVKEKEVHTLAGQIPIL